MIVATTIGNNLENRKFAKFGKNAFYIYIWPVLFAIQMKSDSGGSHTRARIRQIILLILPNVTLHDSFPLVYETSLLLTFKRFHAHNPNNRVIELSAVPPSNKLCARLFSCLVERNLRVSASVNYLNGDKSMNWKKNRQVDGGGGISCANSRVCKNFPPRRENRSSKFLHLSTGVVCLRFRWNLQRNRYKFIYRLHNVSFDFNNGFSNGKKLILLKKRPRAAILNLR